MAATKEQNYANHVRIVPAYHAGVFGIFVLNLFWSIYGLVQEGTLDSIVRLLLAIALLTLSFYTRIFALTVQDRIIRLEMTLRLEKLLPADLRSRIKDFTVRQLVALRFASDEELSDLARRVLNENVKDGKTIKQMIKRWNPDHLRA